MSTAYDNLSDEGLREELQRHGIACGPIMPSTRSLYIKKLLRLAGEMDELPADEESSEEEVPRKRKETSRSPQTKTKTSPTTQHSTGDSSQIRQRKGTRKLDVKMETSVEEPAGGGFLGMIFRLIIFIVFVAVLYWFVSSFLGAGPRKLLTNQ